MIILLHLVADDRGGGECGGGCEDKSVLQALGTMTEPEILAQVLGRKQRGHLSGRGKKVVKKYQEDLAAQQKAIGQQSENFQRMLEFLS
ncbi:hypothetical protein Tco_1373296 [Tanacetum coccineum]